MKSQKYKLLNKIGKLFPNKKILSIYCKKNSKDLFTSSLTSTHSLIFIALMSKKEYAKLNTNNDDDESVPLKKAQGDDSSSSDEHIDAVANISKVGFGTAFKNIIINSLVVSSVYIINTITRNVSFHFVRPEGTLITSAFGVGNTFLTIFCVAIIVSLNVGMLINSSKQYG